MEKRKNNKIKIKLNDANNLRDLLQEPYNLADSQIIQAQQEMARLASATDLTECIMEDKGKYAKAMNDFLNIKDKAISKKMDIAKLMSEVIKYNGNINEAVNGGVMKETKFDFSAIREMIENESKQEEEVKTIKLNKEIKNK